MKLNESIDKAVTLLETIGRHPQGATVTQLAAEAGIPRPTATRLLATLEARTSLSAPSAAGATCSATSSAGSRGPSTSIAP